jgi:hypothetical protein
MGDRGRKSILYNKQVQSVLEQEFAKSTLDILGFDACLMGMIETGYAFDASSKIMIASEEVIPFGGWSYKEWIGRLTGSPSATPAEVSAWIVEAFRMKYESTDYITTLSAIKLDGIRALSEKLSAFSSAVLLVPGEMQLLYEKRKGLTSYGQANSLDTSVDLITLLKRYQLASTNDALKTMVGNIIADYQDLRIANFASKRSASGATRGPYGSEGLAIYFPRDQKAFKTDPFSSGYLKSNTHYPVDFVVQERWPEVLYAVLNIRK